MSDDDVQGDSNSIQNQKKLLAKYAKEYGLTNTKFCVDDGFTGTNFSRPDFQKMTAAVGAGCVGAILVKDKSRLGRNYREVDYYTEEFFPDHDVRFISLSDGMDSTEGEDDFAPFKNIMNEWYAKVP